MNGKIIKKKVNVRVEHVRPSTSRKEWIERVKQNEVQKKAVKAGTAGTSSMPCLYVKLMIMINMHTLEMLSLHSYMHAA